MQALREIDRLATEATNDPEKMTQLITQNERFIMKAASRAAHRYLTKSDDEWSIALLAFAQAAKTYQFDKGSFLHLAELVIKRRMLDYSRQQIKQRSEIPVHPSVFDNGPDEEDGSAFIRISVTAKLASVEERSSISLEIQAANELFSGYGFSFFDLSHYAPQTQKTKSACAKAAVFLLKNPPLLRGIRVSGYLPLKIIEKNTNVPRKVLERHRKYIIAAVEMLSGEFPYLAEYLRYIKEELDK